MHPDAITSEVAYTLYLCHSLSTWNARMYEFAAVLFTAAAFPDDLLASSIFGIILSLAVLLFASLLGTWVDRAPSRLATLISTISANRISVIAACVGWFFIVGLHRIEPQTPKTEALRSIGEDAGQQPPSVVRGLKIALFALVVFLSIVERLSRTANLLSIERDWIPAMAAPTTSSIDGDEIPRFGLAEMNAVMSRIDLICKLLSPIVMSAFMSLVGSVRLAILALVVLNAITWPGEIWSATRVYKLNNRLKEPKTTDQEGPETNESIPDTHPSGDLGDEYIKEDTNWLQRTSQKISHAFKTTTRGVKLWVLDYRGNVFVYFAYPVWIASMALSTLHFSVLNYSPTLTVYLLSSGFTVNFITIAKSLSAIAELASTFFTPWGVRRAGKIWKGRKSVAPEFNDDVLANGGEAHVGLLSDPDVDAQENGQEELGTFAPEVDMGVATLGLWSLIQMFLSLIPACMALWYLSFSSNTSDNRTPPSTLISIILLTTIPFSRFGRWTNHLTTQQLTQTLVPPSKRSAFGGAEMGFVSLFGLGHWVVTAIWSKHVQFRWLALGSVGSVALSIVIYLGWLGRQSQWRKWNMTTSNNRAT